MEYIIDRFEGGFALCEAESKEMVAIPTDELPTDAAEGDVLTIQDGILSIDHSATASRREQNREALEKLMG